MSSLSETISLVAAVAAVVGPTTVAAQRHRRGGGRQNFFPRSHQSSDDRALRTDGDANATAAATVPEVASIVNGTSTGGPRPYMVGLGQSDGSGGGIDPFCGGSLINPYVVLTAAHCMYFPIDNWDPPNQVYVNLYDVNDPAGVVTINIEDPSEGGKDIVVHPDWNFDTAENDIALIFLPVGQVADYAQINDDPHEPVVPEPLRLMGWGRTEYGGDTSDVLLETTVDYISNEECKEAYADEDESFAITDGMICGYKKFTGVCNGDSGGPMFLVDKDGEIGDQPTQVGIFSFFEAPCASPGYPDVYTRVSYYSEWIKETVCSRPEHATKELCGSSKSGKSTKSSSYAP